MYIYFMSSIAVNFVLSRAEAGLAECRLAFPRDPILLSFH